MYEDCSICSLKCKLNAKVKQIKDDKLVGHTCDYCSRVVCKNCSQISSTEIRCLELSTRILLFYCPDCINNIKVEQAKQQQSLNIQSEHENTIASLTKELTDIREANDDLLDKIDKSREQINKCLNDIDELNELNNNMITSIRTLEAENVAYRNQIKSLQTDIADYREVAYLELNSNMEKDRVIQTNPKQNDIDDTRMHNNNEGFEKENFSPTQDMTRNCGNIKVRNQCNYKDNHDPVKKSSEVVKSKVLVYGDGSAKNYSLNLKSYLEDKVYMIEGIVKPGADMGEISNSIFNVTLGYSQNDYVIVFLDISYISSISYLALREILAIGKFTNLIFCFKSRGHTNFKKLDRYLQTFRRNKNLSIKIIKNVCVNHKFSYGYKSLSKLLASHVNNNLRSNIVIKSAHRVEVDWSKGDLSVIDSLVEFHGDTTLNKGHRNEGLEVGDKESNNSSFLEEMIILFSP